MAKNTKQRRRLKSATTLPDVQSGEQFDALSAEQKEALWNYYDREIPLSEMRKPNAQERARMSRIRRKAGRPKVGQGSKVVAVTIEKGLLHRADAFAKEHALKRAELVARGLKMVLGEVIRTR